MDKKHKSNSMKEIKKQFQAELKESFNEDKFDEDIKSGKSISLNDLNDYRKKKEKKKVINIKEKDPNKNNMSNAHGLSFMGGFKNGEFIAIGSNGHVIKSKNIDDFHRKLAQVFKINALKNGKEPECTLRIGKNVENPKMWAESFARNFINAGVVVKGDVPKSPEFWDRMKIEYLCQKDHDLETWNNLTRFVPKEYMQSKEKTTQYKSNTKQKSISSKKAPTTFVNQGRCGR